MKSRRRISALQRFFGKPIAIRDAMELVLFVSAWRRPSPRVRFGAVVRPRMVCTRCGIVGADARPNWKSSRRGKA
jgi:hypothetical protein